MENKITKERNHSSINNYMRPRLNLQLAFSPPDSVWILDEALQNFQAGSILMEREAIARRGCLVLRVLVLFHQSPGEMLNLIEL